MEPVAEGFTFFVLLLLGCFYGPEDATEFNMSIIEERGYADTMIVRKAKHGYDLYDQQGDKKKQFGTITIGDADMPTYSWVQNGDKKEECDFSSLMQTKSKFQDVSQVKTTYRGQKIRITKHGEAIFVDQEGKSKTLVIHW